MCKFKINMIKWLTLKSEAHILCDLDFALDSDTKSNSGILMQKKGKDLKPLLELPSHCAHYSWQ